MPDDKTSSLTTTIAQESRYILLKLAEVLEKMRILKKLSPYHQTEVATQAKFLYAPIAHRLGMSDVKAELEDLYLKFYAAPVYFTINQMLGATFQERLELIESFQQPLELALQEAGFRFTTNARVKSISSIIEKMRRLRTSLDEIYDIFAIRVILEVPFQEETVVCWKAHDLLKSRYQTLPKKFRDWLHTPRENGYQALHLTVKDQESPWVEVQIRSQRMDNIAERGSAAHWKYKSGNSDYLLEDVGLLLAQVRVFIEKHPELLQEVFSPVKGNRVC